MLTDITILEFCAKYKQHNHVFVFNSGNQKMCTNMNECSFSATYKSVIGSTVPNYLSFYNDDGYLCLRNVKKIIIYDMDSAWSECKIKYEAGGVISECVVIIKKL